MQFEFSPHDLTKISSDSALVFVFAGDKTDKKKSFNPLESFVQLDVLLQGQLTHVTQLEGFTGKKEEMLTVVPHGESLFSRVIVIGLGERKDFTANDLRNIMGTFSRKMRTKIDSASLLLPTKKECGIDPEHLVYVIVEGVVLGGYTFIKYKKEQKKEREFSTVIIGGQKMDTPLQKVREKAHLVSKATMVGRDLINETPTIATPTYLAELAEEIAKSNKGITCKVYEKEELEVMGMGAFLGIARASATPPKFIHLEYTPQKKTTEKLAFVGKGITYDSGGINVKPGDYMHDMKSDMSGAAAVLGVFSIIAELQPKMSVMGLIAATPNMISGTSIVPDDVVTALNGKTIEIINTDAEGRVTLADSLSYAVKKGATRIVDFATLTGACMVALGDDIAGLFSNNKELTNKVKMAADNEGEKVWEMPLEKTYKELNKSNIADIANLSSSRYGGTITAALFLEAFVSNIPWAHIDIAGPAFSKKSTPLGPQGGTGFGVRIMVQLLDLL
jgi:leucyl aminopeptidase